MHKRDNCSVKEGLAPLDSQFLSESARNNWNYCGRGDKELFLYARKGLSFDDVTFRHPELDPRAIQARWNSIIRSDEIAMRAQEDRIAWDKQMYG